RWGFPIDPRGIALGAQFWLPVEYETLGEIVRHLHWRRGKGGCRCGRRRALALTEEHCDRLTIAGAHRPSSLIEQHHTIRSWQVDPCRRGGQLPHIILRLRCPWLAQPKLRRD